MVAFPHLDTLSHISMISQQGYQNVSVKYRSYECEWNTILGKP